MLQNELGRHAVNDLFAPPGRGPRLAQRALALDGRQALIDQPHRHRQLPAQGLDKGGHALRLNALLAPQRQRQPDDDQARLGKAASRTVEIESERVTVVSQDDHLVAVVGVKHLVVVHTPTATLICRADRAQAVRDVVRRLSADPKLARYL